MPTPPPETAPREAAPPRPERPPDALDARQRAVRAGRRRFWLLAPFALAAGLAVPYLMTNDEPGPVTAWARREGGGSYATLSAGVTHYEETGSPTGPTVVLVHGVSVPLFVWDDIIPPLVNAELHIVRYDLYGRGLSDRPEHARYDLDLYDTQLLELLAKVSPGAPVDLVGMSMGGIVVAEFARRHPERVRRLVLVDPAGVGTNTPALAKVALLPGVGEYVMRVGGTRQLMPSQRNLLHPARFPDFDARYRRTLGFTGSRRAVLESLRHMPLDDYEAGYRELGKLGKPTLLVWGRQDKVIPFENSAKVRELVHASDLVAVDDAGHLPQVEHPEVVGPALARFLTR